MDLAGRVVVVTGGASGIGRAMASRFVEEGASVAVADIDEMLLSEVGAALGVRAFPTDVSVETQVEALVADVEDHLGPIDVFCSNAGIAKPSDPWSSSAEWLRTWDVNVMAHVLAARAVLPGMLDRGRGYLLQTASAAGLTTQLGSATYAVTKHAAIAFAEWLAITYGERGIRVSVLAPQAVRTAMTDGIEDSPLGVAAVDGMLEPDVVADLVVETMRSERFLCLPHPEVETYFRRKAADYDRWIAGMQRLQHQFFD